MESIKKYMAVALFCLICSQAAALGCQEHPLSPERLPENIQTLIKENFSNLSVARAAFEDGRYYEVVLSDNTNLEFDNEGNWTKIECQETAIPNQLLPAAVLELVKDKYPGTLITKIEKERGEYEVKLSDHSELTFDSNFQLVVTAFDCP